MPIYAINSTIVESTLQISHPKFTISLFCAPRRTTEEIYNVNREVTLVFVDFKQASDSVDRQLLFEILNLYGTPQEIVYVIKVLCTDTRQEC